MQGARVASAMAAANPDKALACIFFSYPLHTPRNQVFNTTLLSAAVACARKLLCVLASSCAVVLQDNLRDFPLVELTLPILFVHGSNDTMCEADTFQAVRGRMSCSESQVYLLHHCLA